MKIGSWTYDGFYLDILPESLTMDVSKSPSNPEWELVSTSVKRNVQFYPCCPGKPYPDVTYTIKIKRRVQSYWMNFFYPGVFLTVMTMMTFITAATDTGERISLVLTSLVSMFVFLKLVGERTPASDNIPLLSIYFVILIFEIGLIFYMVCITLSAFHKHSALGAMPSYIRTLVLKKLGGFWGMTKDSEDIEKRLHALKNLSLLKEELARQLEQMKIGLYKVKSPSKHTVSDEADSVPFKRAVTGVEDKYCKRNHQDVRPLPNVKLEISQSNSVFAPRQKAICTCSALLQNMVAVNKRLLFSVREIVHVARRFDKTSSEKEQWLIAASILDRAFLLFFVLIFILISLVNLLK